MTGFTNNRICKSKFKYQSIPTFNKVQNLGSGSKTSMQFMHGVMIFNDNL